jgi:hypothetical protein
MTKQTLSAITATLLLVLVGSGSLQAQGFVNAKYAGDFLGFGVGGRAAGLGGAGTGYADDVTAGYFNPAALARIEYLQGSILHESRFAGQINYDYFAAAYPFAADQTVGLTVFRLGLDGIKDSRNALVDRNGNGRLDETDRIDSSKITFGGASSWAVMASYARPLTPELSVGGNVKFFYKSVLEHSAWGVGVDVSASYRPVEGLSLGATLSDATKSLLIWDTGNQEFIVPSLRLGAAYRQEILTNHSLMPTVDGIFRFEGRHATTLVDLTAASLDIAAGLEYSYKDRVFLRGGFSELQQITVGAGIKLPKLSIDYAFTNESSDLQGFGPTHRVSLTLTLEEAKFGRPK